MNQRRWLTAILLPLLLCGCSGLEPMPEKTGSIGRTNDGTLLGGVQLAGSDDIIVLEPQFAWGTPNLVHGLQATAAAMREAYPDTVPMVVGHLSRETGGPLRPHSSHQSGRDVDVALYATDNRLVRGFRDMRNGDLDVAKSWFFIEKLLENADVQFILLDWEVQKIMFEQLQLFESERKLKRLFQYPRPRDSRTGIIRHAPGHPNHFHIRIQCPKDDWYCLQ